MRVGPVAKQYSARCACGAVTFEFDTDQNFVAVCHCLDCKKASGGEAATIIAVPENDFSLLSGNPEPRRYVADSGHALYRNFCPTCGSRLFTNNLEGFPGLVFVMLGSLEHPELIEPKLEMFTKRRMKWAPQLNLPQFETMPQ
jgi:hypothetical protein